MDNDSSARIADRLRGWIATAGPGARLPSTRTLVSEYAASPVTVQRAVRTLVAAGLVETRPGVGTFVRAETVPHAHDFGWQTMALGSPATTRRLSTMLDATPGSALALNSGYPADELLPAQLVRAAFGRAARAEATMLRPPTAGLPALQGWLATELGSSSHGVSGPVAQDVVIVPGSQSGLNAVFRSLVGAGRPLLMESPTYWGAIVAAAQVGVQVIPVPTGRCGPDPDLLAQTFARSGARAFYAQPNFANPTGAQWDPQTSARVLEVVRAHGAFLVEDDGAHGLVIEEDQAPIAARDDSGHVVYLRSFTKSVSPAVRVAAVIARGPARDRILADVRAEAMFVSGLLQTVALDVVTQPRWRTHLRRLRQQLRARRDLLIDSLQEHAPMLQIATRPAGGLNLWGRLPDAVDVDALVRTCADQGVLLTPGAEFFPAEPTGSFLRLSYAGADPGSFPEGARVLGAALRG